MLVILFNGLLFSEHNLILIRAAIHLWDSWDSIFGINEAPLIPAYVSGAPFDVLSIFLHDSSIMIS